MGKAELTMGSVSSCRLVKAQHVAPEHGAFDTKGRNSHKQTQFYVQGLSIFQS